MIFVAYLSTQSLQNSHDLLLTQYLHISSFTIQCDTIAEFNVDSKAECTA